MNMLGTGIRLVEPSEGKEVMAISPSLVSLLRFFVNGLLGLRKGFERGLCISKDGDG